MKRARQAVLLTLITTIFAGVVFHAPLSVWLGSVLPDLALPIKAWKEVLLVGAVLLVGWELSRQKLWSWLLRDWLFQLALAYSLLHLAMVLLWPGDWQPIIAGLLINLRFVVFLVVCYAALKLYPEWRRPLVGASVVAAAVSMLFALLQVTVLPPDALAAIGYGEDTIAPSLTVDQNPDYMRINGTLRGPNPLGLYATMIFVAGLAFLWSRRQRWRTVHWAVGLLGLISLPALWFSYSRSAVLAWGVAVLIWLFVAAGRKYGKLLAVACLSGALLLGGVTWMARDSSFVRHVVIHEDPNEGSDVNSNEGHLESLVDGTERMLRQPLGAGVGTTGSPSLMGKQGNIIENDYLYVAHEVGWIGLGLFVWLSVLVLVRLWQQRHDWLALAVLASGAGIMMAGLVLPVWADDTVALVWWGLAGIVLAAPLATQKGGNYGRAIE